MTDELQARQGVDSKILVRAWEYLEEIARQTDDKSLLHASQSALKSAIIDSQQETVRALEEALKAKGGKNDRKTGNRVPSKVASRRPTVGKRGDAEPKRPELVRDTPAAGES